MPTKLPTKFRIREIDAIVIIVILALVHGLLYVLIIPPWQHYDEPNHFEYVWLTAAREGLPEMGDFNPHLTYEILKSMIEHGFYKNLGHQPELGSPYDHTAVPGYSQLGGQPFYYWLFSIPLRFALKLDITNQMYVLRLVSLVIYLCTVVIAWFISRELTPPQHPIRFLTPLTLALFPGYVDIMTSINNDVGAVLIMSLSLWGCIRLASRGFSFLSLILAAVPAGLSLFTKSTAVVSLFILPAALLFSVFRNRKRKYAWVLLILGSIAFSSMMFSWDEAAFWYRSVAQEEPVRIQNDKAVLGEYAFSMNNQSEVRPNWTKPVFQPVPRSIGWEVKDKNITFGFWSWSSQPISIRSPIIQMSNLNFSETIQVNEEPKFFAYQLKLNNPYPRIWVTLQPQTPKNQGEIDVFYDGLTLVEGQYPVDEIPQYDSKLGDTGTWSNTRFTNIIRNGSAESVGIRFSPRYDEIGSKFLGDNAFPSLVLTSLLDWRGAGFMYSRTFIRMFRTFWAKFGWGNVELLGSYPYRKLGYFSVLLAVGIIIGLVTKWRSISREIITLLIVSILITFMAAFVRGAVYLPVPDIYLPVGRYLYPVMIPIALGMSFGWVELTNPIIRTLEKLKSYGRFFNLIDLLSTPEWQVVVYLLLFLFLDVYSLISITDYFISL